MQNISSIIMVGVGVVLCGCTARPTSAPSDATLILYVHVGIDTGSSAKRLLCAKVRVGEPIFAAGDDYWKLTGHIERQGSELVADLQGDTGSQSQFYRGKVTLETPLFAQGGAASGGVMPMWFLVSTNFESEPVLEKLQEMDRQARKNGQ